MKNAKRFRDDDDDPWGVSCGRVDEQAEIETVKEIDLKIATITGEDRLERLEHNRERERFVATAMIWQLRKRNLSVFEAIEQACGQTFDGSKFEKSTVFATMVRDIAQVEMERRHSAAVFNLMATQVKQGRLVFMTKAQRASYVDKMWEAEQVVSRLVTFGIMLVRGQRWFHGGRYQVIARLCELVEYAKSFMKEVTDIRLHAVYLRKSLWLAARTLITALESTDRAVMLTANAMFPLGAVDSSSACWTEVYALSHDYNRIIRGNGTEAIFAFIVNPDVIDYMIEVLNQA